LFCADAAELTHVIDARWFSIGDERMPAMCPALGTNPGEIPRAFDNKALVATIAR
jgi:hypothetical protein